MATVIRVEQQRDPLPVYAAQSESPVGFNTAALERAQVEVVGSGDEVRAAIRDRIQQDLSALGRLARSLFDDPEVGFEEHRSVARIADFLEQRGVEVELGAFGLDTAFRASLGDPSGPHFALIAEYDALPGVGHACGHNLITAISVGAFLAVGAVVAATGGRVSLIGTPAEENGGGKALIIDAGGFDDVGAAGMVHPAGGDGITPVAGVTTSGVRRVGVTHLGRAAHAAGAPHLGLNALDGVVLGYQAVAALRQHIGSHERVHGIITDGGVAPNVVPERASALYYVRSTTVEQLRSLTDRVVGALEGAAVATGTSAEVTLDPVPPYLPLRENVTLNLQWARALPVRRAELLPESGHSYGPASTDMGNLSQLIPSIHPSIGIGAPAGVSPHTPEFARYTTLPEALGAVEEAAVGLAGAAADWLADPVLRERAQEEFDARGPAVRWDE